MPDPLKFEKKSSDHEAIFLQHYDWLLKWARQLTSGRPGEAEDLVQDLYVRFVRTSSSRELEDDDEARAYLYTALKNLHISKRIRNGRDAISGLRAVDFDSVESALVSIERGQLLHVRGDLARICEYACLRRKTTRAASTLILRFFLGFLPPEIMALLKAKRSNVNSLIENGRLEAKAYISRRGTLRFMGNLDKRPSSRTVDLPEETGALFKELQRRIFAEADGRCFMAGELEERYDPSNTAPFSTTEIAHLASCEKCLNLACGILKLPPFSLRMIDGDEKSQPETGSANKPHPNTLERLRRKLRETDEHRPKKLQVAIDGEVRGIQTVTGAESRFQITLPALSEPQFLEIFSDQGVGLLYIDLRQTSLDDPLCSMAEREFSGARRLDVRATLGDGVPVIEVFYFDPLLNAAEEATEAEGELLASSLTTDNEVGHPETHPLTWMHRWSRAWKNLVHTSRWAVLLTCCLLLILFGFSREQHTSQRSQLRPSARTILEQSAACLKRTVPSHGAIRALYSLDLKDGGNSAPITWHVSLTRSIDSPRRVIKLLSDRNIPVATFTVDAHGSRKLGGVTGDSTNRYREMDEQVWQSPPFASDLESLLDGDTTLSTDETSAGFELSFHRAAEVQREGIVSGKITLAREDLRPVAETLVYQTPKRTREYSYKEVRYEVLRSDQIRSSDFLSGSTDQALAHHAPANDGLPHEILKALEIILDLPDNLRSSVALVRNAGDQFEITGVMENANQKRELERDLSQVKGVRVELHSVEDAVQALSMRRASPEISSVSVTESEIPLAQLLRSSLINRTPSLPESDIAQQVRLNAHDITVESARFRRSAQLVSEIANSDFRPNELAMMTSRDQMLWLSLLEGELSRCHASLGVITSDLNPPTTKPIDARDDSSISDVRQLAAAARSFDETAERLDRLLVVGVTLSPTPTTRPSPKLTDLFPELVDATTQERQLAETVRHLLHAAPSNNTR